MAGRRVQDAKRRSEKKPAPIVETALPHSFKELTWRAFLRNQVELPDALEVPEVVLNFKDLSEARGVALWDEAVESVGRSAGALEELAESTGEAIARISARSDRIDRYSERHARVIERLGCFGGGCLTNEKSELRKVDEGKGKGLSLPSLRKMGEFLANVLTLERSVDALKVRTQSLETEVQRLQRQVDEQAGELKVTFVHSSLRDQIEGRAERAAVRVLERLASTEGAAAITN